ncbi:hypothetical protein K456DRAFT_1948838 [Colletotrichum gloeosporioides 23]|nr:hypothetical protein K456DRAFT_1948838 [Colletotrichum gloeosporioides 23]
MGFSCSIAAAILAGSTAFIHAKPTSFSGCDGVCRDLHQEFPNQVLLRNETAYALEQTSFWSTVQGSASPTCFFTPASANEVSRAVDIARDGQCQFAAKSGGHYSFEASTIDNGLVVDLARMNETVVSDDKRSAVVGPGGRWSSVYPILQEQNLTIPGGRMFGVGVGGLTLGGMSFPCRKSLCCALTV